MNKKLAFIGIGLAIMLLAAGTVFAAASMDGGKPVEIQGTIQELEHDEVLIPTIYLHGNGSGSATGLGDFTVHFEGIVYNNAAGVGVGTAGANITLATGDVIFATFTGVGTPTSTAGVNKIVETYTITGGTGQYADATGSFTVDRQITLPTGESSGTIEGRIKLH